LSIDGEPEVGSTNRKHRDKDLDETNATALSDFANNARIESNYSLDVTGVATASNCGSNLGKQFRDLERTRQEVSSHIYIYILIEFEDVGGLRPPKVLKNVI
jgi:hypothetical protein